MRMESWGIRDVARVGEYGGFAQHSQIARGFHQGAFGFLTQLRNSQSLHTGFVAKRNHFFQDRVELHPDNY